MILVTLILTFILIFLSGMHFAIWKTDHRRSSLFWSIGLGLFGLYHIIALIGKVAR
jgi:hypothetical protein